MWLLTGQYESSCSSAGRYRRRARHPKQHEHFLSGAHNENRKRQKVQFSGKETHRWMVVPTEVGWMILVEWWWGGGGKNGATTAGMS